MFGNLKLIFKVSEEKYQRTSEMLKTQETRTFKCVIRGNLRN